MKMQNTEWIKGIPVKNVSMKETIDQIGFWIENKRAGFPPAYVATVNLDYLVACQSATAEGQNLKSFLRTTEWVIADGKPVQWMSQLFGNGLRERVPGSDLVPLLGSVSTERNWKIYVVGGSQDSVAKTSDKWKANYGSSPICGVFNGKIDIADTEKDSAVVNQINALDADILLIALGSPKQEIWFERVKSKLNVAVAIGVGGSFEMVSGNVKRAPVWVQNIGAEWLVRLAQEPSRLFKRYFNDGLWFSMWLVKGIYGLFMLKMTSGIYDTFNKCERTGSINNEIKSVLNVNSKFMSGYKKKKIKMSFRKNLSGMLLTYGLKSYTQSRFNDDQILIENA